MRDLGRLPADHAHLEPQRARSDRDGRLRAMSGACSGRRKTSTRSNGPVAATAVLERRHSAGSPSTSGALGLTGTQS